LNLTENRLESLGKQEEAVLIKIRENRKAAGGLVDTKEQNALV